MFNLTKLNYTKCNINYCIYFILLWMIANAHLGYWCTSGVCRCTDSPSAYCRVKANKICVSAHDQKKDCVTDGVATCSTCEIPPQPQSLPRPGEMLLHPSPTQPAEEVDSGSAVNVPLWERKWGNHQLRKLITNTFVTVTESIPPVF